MSEFDELRDELHKQRQEFEAQCSMTERALKLEAMLDEEKKELQVLKGKAFILNNIVEDKKTTEEKKRKSKVEAAEVNVHIARLQNRITELENNLKEVEYNQTGKKFNKYLCLSNIRELLKESDVKIGQIEKEANCQPGYMSRLEKKTNNTDPSLEFLITAAKMLGISLDVLLFTDLKELSPTEKYLIAFIQKLKTDTLGNKLDWTRESAGYLNRLEGEKNGNTEHPLFTLETFLEQGECEYPEEITDVRFVSNSFDCNTYIAGDCFNLKMQKNSTLYLMNIGKNVPYARDNDDYAKEIWMYTPGVGKQFIISTKDAEHVAEQIEALYDIVSKSMKHPKIKEEVKSVIDAFMQTDLGEDDDKLLLFGELPLR